MFCMVSKLGLVVDTNNGFVGLLVTELLEFFCLMFIGIFIAFVLTGSWELTGIVIFVDFLQNLVVFVWLKYLRNRKVFKGFRS